MTVPAPMIDSWALPPSTNFAGGIEPIADGDDRPLPVVEVEDRVDADQVHVRLVVGVDGPDVLPVGLVALGLAGDLVGAEVVDVRQTLLGQVGDDVAAHVVHRVVVGGVRAQRVDQPVAA